MLQVQIVVVYKYTINSMVEFFHTDPFATVVYGGIYDPL
jgi:hypothetical protein